MLDNSANSTSLKGLFQGLVPDPCGILQGKVISTAPLKIQAVNDKKLIIGALLLIVPKHLSDYTAEVDISIGGGNLASATDMSDSHSHALKSFSLQKATLTLRNALKEGEKVHLLSLNNGKKYYVLDRVV